MPHIEGHIEDPPSSVGILKLDENSDEGMYFVPPSTDVWKIPKKPSNDDWHVAFDVLVVPIGVDGRSIIIAYNVVQWKNRDKGLTDKEIEKMEKDKIEIKKKLRKTKDLRESKGNIKIKLNH